MVQSPARASNLIGLFHYVRIQDHGKVGGYFEEASLLVGYWSRRFVLVDEHLVHR